MKYPEASFCSFCTKDRQHTSLLIQSGPVAICESCAGMCAQIVVEHFTGLKEKLKTIRFEDGPPVAVESDPERMGGVPVVAGTRYTLAQLLAELAEGHPLIEVADDQGLSFEACAAALRELAQSSSAPPGGSHRTANPELCVGTAENPDHRLLTDQTGGTGRAEAPQRERVGHEAARGLLEDLIAGRGGVVNRELLARYIDEQEERLRPSAGNRERARQLLKRILPLFPREYWEPSIMRLLEESLNDAEARGMG